MRTVPRILIESGVNDSQFATGRVTRESSAWKPPLNQLSAVALPNEEGLLVSDDDATLRWNGVDFDEVDVDD